MSFLTGLLSGSLVAGGVYYGFSNLIRNQTDFHRANMHALAYTYSSSLSPSTSSSSPSTPPLNSPPPASTRINHPTPLSTNLTRAWNAHIGHAFTTLHSASDSLADWGRSSFYGLGLGTHSGSKEGKGGLKEELVNRGNGI